MPYYNNRGKSTVLLERHVFLQNMIPERKYTFCPFISDHQGINIRAMLFPPFQKISIGKAGGGASYCCQMFWLSHYESRCCIQAVLCYSWQELTQIKLCTTLSDGDEFGLVFFLLVFKSIMCGNCIAWNDLEIFCYRKTIWRLLSWATMETPCCSEVCLEFVFHCHKAIIICVWFWVIPCTPERSIIYYSRHISVHNMWGAGQMRYKKTVPAVKNLQLKQRKEKTFRGKEM